MRPEFRAFSAGDAITVASAALSRAWGERVTIDETQNLGNEERRNLILRARIARGVMAPQSVIIKATRAVSYRADAADAYATSGFVKEWAASNYLAHNASRHPFTPVLLAHDVEQGVLVYEDAGDGLPSLVNPLLHGTADEAERSLIAYAEALAALHSASIGCRDDHARILRAGFPATEIPPPAHRWIENVARVPHALLGGEFPEADMRLIHRHLEQPGSWLALLHGDPCPDNVLLPANGHAVLIDFEFARPGHVLLDASYWRVAFPTCWCAGTIPVKVGHRIDRAYRDAIAGAVPEASSDDAFQREITIIESAWLLGSLAWLLQDALVKDHTWGRATNRSRILTYLEHAVRSTGEADTLPGLRALAASWYDDLRHRWPDTPLLSDFPAFCPGH